MPIRYATPVITHELQQKVTDAGSGAILRIYAGVRPVTANVAITNQPLLYQGTCGSPFGTVTDETLTVNVPASTAITGSGTASFFRLFKSDGVTVVCDGDASDLGLSSLAFSPAAGPLTISSWYIYGQTIVSVGTPLSVSGSAPSTGIVGGSYSVQFAASGGNGGPYTYVLASGALPAGTTLNPNTGLVSGTLASAQSVTYTIAASDGASATAISSSQSTTITAPAVLAITGTAPNGTVGVGYSYQYTFSGGSGSGRQASLGSGTLPPGLTLSTTGLLSGTPTTAAAYTFVIHATDSAAGSANSATQSVTVAAPAVDTRPRAGTGSATAGVTSPAALLASLTPVTAGTSGSASIPLNPGFTVAPAAGQYGWIAFPASLTANGVTFSDSLGTGGWQGASSSGNNSGDSGASPNTSSVVYNDGTTTWRFFRQSYAAAGGTFGCEPAASLDPMYNDTRTTSQSGYVSTLTGFLRGVTCQTGTNVTLQIYDSAGAPGEGNRLIATLTMNAGDVQSYSSPIPVSYGITVVQSGTGTFSWDIT